MKRNILLIASGSFLALNAVSVAAQEVPPVDTTVETEVTAETPTDNGQGATVTHETTTTTTTAPDADGAPVSTTTVDTMKSVETPSGNTTVVSRVEGEDGKTDTTVDHTKMDHSQHPQPAKDKEPGKPDPK